ncbi:MAG: hypothetical protein A2139_13925 [Desulfobacca sp. RBG_16_60_12]|nr:MAG: hypothetical protein A2139_13925 [Desulfobacca sp. RBG_16_60_12]
MKLAGRKRVLLSLLLAWSFVIFPLGSPASGEDVIESKPGGLPVAGEHGDLTELARHLNNPVGPVWNIVTQNNWYFQKGFPSTAYRVQYVLNFQPVLPIPLTRELNLVMRPVVPLESNPYASGLSLHPLGVDWSRTAGLGDITLEPFLVPNWKPWLIFGAAPSLVLPTATDKHLGPGKVQLGPAVVLGFLTKQWIGGVFVQNWWSLAGNNSNPVVNQMNLQYFLYRMLPDAWQVGFAPNVLVNWRADGKNQVTFPLGLGVGKTFKLGGLPPSRRAWNFSGWRCILMISASVSTCALFSSRWCRPW